MREYVAEYQGKVTSLNDTNGQSWRKRADATNKFHGIFKILMLEAKFKPLKKFRLDVRYNSRHDCDNIVFVAKVFVDTMKGDYIKNDTKEFYRGISITPDEKLKYNTFIFKISELK